MENGEHDDSVTPNCVEDGIRETPSKDAPELAMQFRMGFGIGTDTLNRAIDLGEEIVAQTGKLLAVPPICL